MIAALLLSVTGFVAVAGERGFSAVPIELEGPLERVLLRGRLPVATEVRVSVPEGGRRRILVPLAGGSMSPVGEQLRPRVELIEPAVPEGGRVRIESALADVDETRWTELPIGLRLRSRPPLSSKGLAPWASYGTVPGALLLATLLAFAGWRRRSARAALASVSLAVVLAIVLPLGPQASSREEVASVVLERAEDEDLWLRVWGGEGEVTFAVDPARPEQVPLRVESEPEGVPLRWTVGDGMEGAVTWSAHAPGARIHVVQPFAPPGLLQPTSNEFGELAMTWFRSASGAWRSAGPWRVGDPAPRTASSRVEGTEGGTSAPPGWLASGLPQGVSILLARVAEEPGQPETWLRWVGF